MFQLTQEEYDDLVRLRSQFVTLKRGSIGSICPTPHRTRRIDAGKRPEQRTGGADQRASGARVCAAAGRC